MARSFDGTNKSQKWIEERWVWGGSEIGPSGLAFDQLEVKIGGRYECLLGIDFVQGGCLRFKTLTSELS